jgi:hypothetical protein
MEYGLHDLLGNLGVIAILGCYLLLQLGRLTADHMSFSMLNGLGALLIIVSLFFEFNLSAFLIEFFWLLISLYGIYRAWTGHSKNEESGAAL